MKWLPGGWQRSDQVATERRTVPRKSARSGGGAQATRVFRENDRPEAPGHTALSEQTRDVDVSASSFRMVVFGGGSSGFIMVVCAAIIALKGASVGMWMWQLVSGVVFLWFVTSARGMFSSRGFLFDHSGFYARTRGEVVGVPWSEIHAIGIGTLPWIQHNRPVNPERRRALEFYPADAGFAARHPEFERWRVADPAPMPGLPDERYRFHLPPLTRLPRSLEQAVQPVAARKWLGHYQRRLPEVPQH